MSLSKSVSPISLATAGKSCAHYYHPGQTCTEHFKDLSVGIGKSAMALFLPLHLVCNNNRYRKTDQFEIILIIPSGAQISLIRNWNSLNVDHFKSVIHLYFRMSTCIWTASMLAHIMRCALRFLISIINIIWLRNFCNFIYVQKMAGKILQIYDNGDTVGYWKLCRIHFGRKECVRVRHQYGYNGE